MLVTTLGVGAVNGAFLRLPHLSATGGRYVQTMFGETVFATRYCEGVPELVPSSRFCALCPGDSVVPVPWPAV